jgi:hypothetical protein
LTLTYTAAGEFFRLLFTAHAHPAYYPGNATISLPILFGGAAINYTKQRATLFSTEATSAYNQPLSARRFELMEIFRKGK